MATPRKRPEDKLPVGRKTLYDAKKHPRQAEKLAMLPGMTDKRMAAFFEVSESTLTLWKSEYPELSAAIKNGREGRVAAIGQSLYERATGYKHRDVHVSNYMGEVTLTPVMKHYPPDVAAAKMLLYNIDRDNWRGEKVDVGVTIEDIDDSKLESKLSELIGKALAAGASSGEGPKE